MPSPCGAHMGHGQSTKWINAARPLQSVLVQAHRGLPGLFARTIAHASRGLLVLLVQLNVVEY
jgi:hypothetical protein